MFVECNKRGYTRSYDSMCKQIRDRKWNIKKIKPEKSYTKSNWKPEEVSYPREKVQIGIKYKNTRLYSPWQSGKVERSHRDDQERFYDNRSFESVEDMHKQHQRYINRGNNIARKMLNFLSPNQVVENYFSAAV